MHARREGEAHPGVVQAQAAWGSQTDSYRHHDIILEVDKRQFIITGRLATDLPHSIWEGNIFSLAFNN